MVKRQNCWLKQQIWEFQGWPQNTADKNYSSGRRAAGRPRYFFPAVATVVHWDASFFSRDKTAMEWTLLPHPTQPKSTKKNKSRKWHGGLWDGCQLELHPNGLLLSTALELRFLQVESGVFNIGKIHIFVMATWHFFHGFTRSFSWFQRRFPKSWGYLQIIPNEIRPWLSIETTMVAAWDLPWLKKKHNTLLGIPLMDCYTYSISPLTVIRFSINYINYCDLWIPHFKTPPYNHWYQ